jgi:hypothetical protein
MTNALSQQTLGRCRAAFEQCAEFTSDALLRSVFVTEELAPFRLGLPSASALGERIALALEYLLTKKHRSGQPALLFFVAALRDRYQPGDAIREELDALHGEISAELSPGAPSNTPLPAPPAGPNTATVRALLNDAFSDGELTTLCFDYYPAVYDQFSGGMSKLDKIQRLIEHCARQGQMAALLSKVQELNPAQYNRYAGRL